MGFSCGVRRPPCGSTVLVVPGIDCISKVYRTLLVWIGSLGTEPCKSTTIFNRWPGLSMIILDESEILIYWYEMLVSTASVCSRTFFQISKQDWNMRNVKMQLRLLKKCNLCWNKTQNSTIQSKQNYTWLFYRHLLEPTDQGMHEIFETCKKPRSEPQRILEPSLLARWGGCKPLDQFWWWCQACEQNQ